MSHLTVICLRGREAATARAAFIEATVLPDRGMMLLQARVRLASGRIVDAIVAPDPEAAAQAFDGGPDDFAGNKSFSFGGAILAPYANRVRGRPIEGTREIQTKVAGRTVRLPRNWGGKAAGAEEFAMHGLILNSPFEWRQDAPDKVTGRLEAEDFSGRWPGRTVLTVEWRLEKGQLGLRVTAQNVGSDPAPMGLGWHPYFALPSHERGQARLCLAAKSRVLVNNYDEVLPTGRLEPISGCAHDFREARALGDTPLDDCFTDLERVDGEVVAEVFDPAVKYGLRIASKSPQVSAIQVYAPMDKDFVAIEPQFNLADPYGAQWGQRDTGMVTIQPGASVVYDVQVSALDL